MKLIILVKFTVFKSATPSALTELLPGIFNQLVGVTVRGSYLFVCVCGEGVCAVPYILSSMQMERERGVM